MINLVDWSQANALLYFMVGILLLLPLVIAVFLVVMVKKSRKNKDN